MLDARRREGLGDRAHRHQASLSRPRARATLAWARPGRWTAPRFTTPQITFYIGNRAAERSYIRAGFAFAEELRHPDFEAVTGSPGFCRYVRTI
jgi:hypothetical protein